jgi:hypothetical protein
MYPVLLDDHVVTQARIFIVLDPIHFIVCFIEATIQLEGDGAISRHHATITATRAPNTVIPIITLVDEYVTLLEHVHLPFLLFDPSCHVTCYRSKFGSQLTRLPAVHGGEPIKMKCVPKVPLQLQTGNSQIVGTSCN